ncbi:MAG TPA: PIN domain-containing protein [Leucothrix sp.]|nr:PIN domain-containing protein [Leucothrix sp.]
MIYMTERVFFDTNVLVYAYDTHESAKQKIAKNLILENIRNDYGWLSLQVFGEFFNVVTKQIPNPLSSEEAREAIDHLSLLNIADMDMKLVSRAIDAHQKYQTSYWDSLIIASAEATRCSTLLSEDFNTTQEYFGMIALNPFK